MKRGELYRKEASLTLKKEWQIENLFKNSSIRFKTIRRLTLFSMSKLKKEEWCNHLLRDDSSINIMTSTSNHKWMVTTNLGMIFMKRLRSLCLKLWGGVEMQAQWAGPLEVVIIKEAAVSSLSEIFWNETTMIEFRITCRKWMRNLLMILWILLQPKMLLKERLPWSKNRSSPRSKTCRDSKKEDKIQGVRLISLIRWDSTCLSKVSQRCSPEPREKMVLLASERTSIKRPSLSPMSNFLAYQQINTTLYSNKTNLLGVRALLLKEWAKQAPSIMMKSIIQKTKKRMLRKPEVWVPRLREPRHKIPHKWSTISKLRKRKTVTVKRAKLARMMNTPLMVVALFLDILTDKTTKKETIKTNQSSDKSLKLIVKEKDHLLSISIPRFADLIRDWQKQNWKNS